MNTGKFPSFVIQGYSLFSLRVPSKPHFVWMYLFHAAKRDRILRNLTSAPASKETEVLWSDIASRILINVVSHPIEYAKVLIQVMIHWVFCATTTQ